MYAFGPNDYKKNPHGKHTLIIVYAFSCHCRNENYFYLYDFKAYVVCAVLILSIPAAHSHILSGGTPSTAAALMQFSSREIEFIWLCLLLYFCAPRAQSPAKICLPQAAPVKKGIQLQTFYGTSNGVCFLWGTS